MDFTEIYRQSSSLVAFSPGGHFILTAVEDRVIVRRTDTFQITRTWLVDASPSPTNVFFSSKSLSKAKSSSGPISDGWVTHCGWSCDSEYIFAAFANVGVVHILKLRDETWSGRIEAGTEGDYQHVAPVLVCILNRTGLTKAEWAPDGRTILCFSEWGVCPFDKDMR